MYERQRRGGRARSRSSSGEGIFTRSVTPPEERSARQHERTGRRSQPPIIEQKYSGQRRWSRSRSRSRSHERFRPQHSFGYREPRHSYDAQDYPRKDGLREPSRHGKAPAFDTDSLQKGQQLRRHDTWEDEIPDSGPSSSTRHRHTTSYSHEAQTFKEREAVAYQESGRRKAGYHGYGPEVVLVPASSRQHSRRSQYPQSRRVDSWDDDPMARGGLQRASSSLLVERQDSGLERFGGLSRKDTWEEGEGLEAGIGRTSRGIQRKDTWGDDEQRNRSRSRSRVRTHHETGFRKAELERQMLRDERHEDERMRKRWREQELAREERRRRREGDRSHHY